MRRRLLNSVTALSLVLCLAVLLMWARSYAYADCAVVPLGRGWHLTVVSHRAHWLALTLTRNNLPLAARFASGRFDNELGYTLGWAWYTYDSRARVAKVHLIRGRMHEPLLVAPFQQRWVPTGMVRELGLPYDRLAAAFAALPLARLSLRGGTRLVARARRRRRLGAGQCVGCGYDLTANASGVCPECGAPAI